MPTSPEPLRSNPRPPWVIVLIALGAMGSCAFVALPLAVYGLRSYLTRQRTAETQEFVRALSAGVAACASRSRVSSGLPPTAEPVPRALASISGRKYQSGGLDWQDEAYQCARFKLAAVQSAQLQWVRLSEREGYVRAALDLDGDMSPEIVLEQSVSCSAEGHCTLGEVREGH